MTDSFRSYDPVLSDQLEKQFPISSLERRTFENMMPLWVAELPELTETIPHAVVPLLLNGDNWEVAVSTLFSLHVLTQNLDGIGKKVDKLGLLVPFMDQRQDRATRKPFPENPDEVAVVQNQAAMTNAIANLASKVAAVEYMVQLDGHSREATEQFQAAGIEVVNVTAALQMIGELQARQVITDSMPTVTCGVDLGNLSLVKKIHDTFGFEMAIIHKKRIPDPSGVRSHTVHELVFGDVSNKRVLVMDDMIGSFGTMIRTIELLVAQGAREIVLCATHPVFSGEYYKKIQSALAYPQVTCIMGTNSIPLKRPDFGHKEAPYIFTTLQDKRIRKEFEIFDLSQFWSTVVQAMLAKQGNIPELSQALQEHVHEQLDPYQLYPEITGQVITPPKVAGVYLGNGQYRRF